MCGYGVWLLQYWTWHVFWPKLWTWRLNKTSNGWIYLSFWLLLFKPTVNTGNTVLHNWLPVRGIMVSQYKVIKRITVSPVTTPLPLLTMKCGVTIFIYLFISIIVYQIFNISLVSKQKKCTSQWQFYCQGVHRGLQEWYTVCNLMQ